MPGSMSVDESGTGCYELLRRASRRIRNALGRQPPRSQPKSHGQNLPRMFTRDPHQVVAKKTGIGSSGNALFRRRKFVFAAHSGVRTQSTKSCRRQYASEAAHSGPCGQIVQRFSSSYVSPHFSQRTSMSPGLGATNYCSRIACSVITPACFATRKSSHAASCSAHQRTASRSVSMRVICESPPKSPPMIFVHSRSVKSVRAGRESSMGIIAKTSASWRLSVSL